MASLSFFPPSPNTKGTDTTVRSPLSETPQVHHILLAEQAGSPDQPCSPKGVFSTIRAEVLGSQHLHTLKRFIKFFLFSPLSSSLSSSLSLSLPPAHSFFLSHLFSPKSSLWSHCLAHCPQQHDSNSTVAASRTLRFPKALKWTSSRLAWLAIEIYQKWKSCLKGISSENTFQKPLCLLQTITHMKGDKEFSFQEYCHVSCGEKMSPSGLLNGPNDTFILGGGEDHEGRIPTGKRELVQKADRYPAVRSHIWLTGCTLVGLFMADSLLKYGSQGRSHHLKGACLQARFLRGSRTFPWAPEHWMEQSRHPVYSPPAARGESLGQRPCSEPSCGGWETTSLWPWDWPWLWFLPSERKGKWGPLKLSRERYQLNAQAGP